MAEYIEREALISDLKELPEQERIEYMGIYDCIKSQPTADVQEVRHGKWIVSKRKTRFSLNETKCSLCGYSYFTDNSYYNFCPHCGAKMDKE